jgi:hypothetical protein
VFSSGSYVARAGRLADVQTTRVSFYRHAGAIDRFRVDTSAGTPHEISDFGTPAAVDDEQAMWAVARSGPDEIIAWPGAGVALARCDAGDGSTFRDLGQVFVSTYEARSVVIVPSDPDQAVSASFPLNVVWQDDVGMHVALLTSIVPPIGTTPTDFGGGAPTPISELTSDNLRAVSPWGARETAPGHLFVIAATTPTGARYDHQALTVWEFSHSSPNGRELLVPANQAVPTQGLSVGTVGSSIRIAAASDAGLATRGLGCR